jgi:hypothetical protein
VDKEATMTTPVLITAFRRPDFLSRVLNCFEGRSNPIYIWLNGANNPDDASNIQECLKIIGQTSVNVVFVKTNVEHYPSGQSIINAIDWIFSEVSMAIILEDDIMVSQEFISFMDLALDYFSSLDSGVGSIVGSCFVPPNFRSIGPLRRTLFTSSWGWGTWGSRWEKFDRDLLDWDRNKFEFPILLRDFPSRYRFISIFDSIKSATFDAWDYRWQYTNWKNHWQTVAPNANLVTNIGFDSRSTHTFSVPIWLPTTTEKFDLESLDFANIPYDRNGDLWYKSNVQHLDYSYYFRTKIRKIINLFTNSAR